MRARRLQIGGAGLSRFAAVALSAGLYGRAFPPTEIASLSWVALVPLFLALRGRGARSAFLMAAFWAYLATALVISWLVPTLHQHFGWGLVRSLVFLFGFSAVAASPYFGTAFALCALGCRRLHPAARPLLIAAAWVTSELARTHLGFRSPWAKLGDAHYLSTQLRQVADLVGVFGVSFTVALANAVLAELLHSLWSWRRGDRLKLASLAGRLAPASLLVAAALLYGGVRSNTPHAGEQRLEVALVQGNVVSSLRWVRSSASHVLRRYGELTRDALLEARDAPLDLVVWPEHAIQTSLEDATYGPPLRALASLGVPILYGGPRSEVRDGARIHFNSAFLLDGHRPVQHYDKRRLLAFSETRPIGTLAAVKVRGDLAADHYTAGSSVGLFSLAQHSLGVLICMEALYPSLAREAAREGASVLINISNDGWYGGKGGARQHLAQVVFRAIETGLPVVRATSTGVSAVILPNGEITDRLPQREAGVLRASVPIGGDGATWYARTGDVFALACALACLGAALRSAVLSPER